MDQVEPIDQATAELRSVLEASLTTAPINPDQVATARGNLLVALAEMAHPALDIEGRYHAGLLGVSDGDTPYAVSIAAHLVHTELDLASSRFQSWVDQESLYRASDARLIALAWSLLVRHGDAAPDLPWM